MMDCSYKKSAPPQYFVLLKKVWSAVGFPTERNPLIIAIDGKDGVGKSSLASWLAWQIGVPAVHLDLFLAVEDGKISFRYEELSNAIRTRCSKVRARPLIIEGITLLSALKAIKLDHDLLIFVGDQNTDENGGEVQTAIKSYFDEENPYGRADLFVDDIGGLTWQACGVAPAPPPA